MFSILEGNSEYVAHFWKKGNFLGYSVDLITCLKEFKIPISLYTYESFSELPSNTITIVGEEGWLWNYHNSSQKIYFLSPACCTLYAFYSFYALLKVDICVFKALSYDSRNENIKVKHKLISQIVIFLLILVLLIMTGSRESKTKKYVNLVQKMIQLPNLVGWYIMHLHKPKYNLFST